MSTEEAIKWYQIAAIAIPFEFFTILLSYNAGWIRGYAVALFKGKPDGKEVQSNSYES